MLTSYKWSLATCYLLLTAHVFTSAGADKEDRIFFFRQPILQNTGMKDLVQHNKVYCLLLGRDLCPDTKVISYIVIT